MAASCLERARACASRDEKSSLLLEGLDTIDKSEETSEFEKHLARIGRTYNQYRFSPEGIERGRTAVMEAIARDTLQTKASTFAQITLDAMKDIKNPTDEKNIIRDGITLIENDHEGTENEKSFSFFGIVCSREMFHQQDEVKAHSIILSALAAPLTTPVGPVLAGVVRGVLKSMTDTKPMKRVQSGGLQELLKNSNTTGREKSLSMFACRLDGYYMDDENLIKARNSILEELAAPTDRPVAAIIAKTLLDAAPFADDPLAAFHQLGFGFETILKDESTVATHRDIARLGAAVEYKKDDISEGLKRRRILMERLIDPRAGIEEVRELAGPLGNSEEKPAIVVEDDYIDFNGFRLDLQKKG